MTHSPGHQKWPDHAVEEKPLSHRVQIEAGGEIVADSADVIEVDEDDHPARYYVPRSDIRTDKLLESDTRTSCPFKGQARYFNLSVDGKTIEDAAWSYEQPFEEHLALKDRIAFHEEMPDIRVRQSE